MAKQSPTAATSSVSGDQRPPGPPNSGGAAVDNIGESSAHRYTSRCGELTTVTRYSCGNAFMVILLVFETGNVSATCLRKAKSPWPVLADGTGSGDTLSAGAPVRTPATVPGNRQRSSAGPAPTG